MPSKPISTKLDEQTIERLEQRAAAEGVTKSQLVQQAIAQMLDGPAIAPAETAAPIPGGLTLEQLAVQFGVVAVDRGMNGFELGGWLYPNRGAAIDRLQQLTQWQYRDGLFHPPGAFVEPEVDRGPNPAFVPIDGECTEAELIFEYNLMERPPSGDLAPLVEAQRCAPLISRTELISQLTGGQFVYTGRTATPLANQRTVQPLYRRVR